jgi:hypothetical protein
VADNGNPGNETPFRSNIRNRRRGVVPPKNVSGSIDPGKVYASIAAESVTYSGCELVRHVSSI